MQKVFQLNILKQAQSLKAPNMWEEKKI